MLEHISRLLPITNSSKLDIDKVIGSSNNQGAVLLSKHDHDKKERWVIHPWGRLNTYPFGMGGHENQKMFALSPDGSKIATLDRPVAEYDRFDRKTVKEYCRIYINGRLAYETNIVNMWTLQWLSSDLLAWHGHNGDMDLTFVNGENASDYTEYCIPCGIMMKDQPPGSSVKVHSYEDHDYDEEKHEKNIPSQEEYPKYISIGSGGKCCLKFHGVIGPVFDEVSGYNEMVFSEDLSRVGYIGRNTSSFFKVLQRVVKIPLDCLYSVAEWFEYYFGRFGSAVAKPLKGIWFYSLINLLPNPEEFTACTPCDNGKAWKRSYYRAENPMFTSSGRLVVTVWPKDYRCCVAIDEEDGPPFDHVGEIKYNEKEKELSYIGIRDDRVFRMSVIC